MSALTDELREYIEENTIRLEASYRGGGIEIDAAEYLGIDDAKLTAYQNYLGGGMLGAIQNSYNWAISEARDREDENLDGDRLQALATATAEYFHEITNHEDDEWEAATFEENQRRPGSAY